MKKLFKSLTIMLITVCAAVACAVAVTGCANNNVNADYTFLIQYEDGTAVNGQTGGNEGGKVITQICMLGEGGKCIGLSMNDIYPDENGKLTLSQEKVNELFESEEDITNFAFHVLYVPEYNSDCEFEIDGKNEYTCKLYK